MDMSRSEAGMAECENGHTFCEDHQRDVEVTEEEKRQFLIRKVEEYDWKKPEDKAKDIEKYKGMSSADLDEDYQDYINDGMPAQYCPICMLEELDDRDALRYLLKKAGFSTMKEVLTKVVLEFATYDAFQAFIRPPKKQ
jgi:hypothetical protein